MGHTGRAQTRFLAAIARRRVGERVLKWKASKDLKRLEGCQNLPSHSYILLFIHTPILQHFNDQRALRTPAAKQGRSKSTGKPEHSQKSSSNLDLQLRVFLDLRKRRFLYQIHREFVAKAIVSKVLEHIPIALNAISSSFLKHL
jgi:hypothetical protein